ncbi:MAG: Type secretion system domain [Clostridiales bacterium]|nr:Type secretion system domain [Clostridiales bacterium]
MFFIKSIFFCLLAYLLLDFRLRSSRFLRLIEVKGGRNRHKKAVESLGRKFSRYFDREEIEKKIRMAGRPFKMTPEVFIALKIIVPFLSFAVQATWDTPLYWKIGVALFSFILPDLFLNMAIKDRKKEIESEIPEVTDIFEAAAAAGIDIGEVFRLAAEFTKGKELKKELTLLAAEYAITKDRVKALTRFRENIGLYDTDILSLALLQGDITGRAGGMLESLASAQHDNVIAKLHREDKLMDYKVLIACALMAVGIASMFLYPFFASVSTGLEGIFN